MLSFLQTQLTETEVDEHLVRLPKLKAAFQKFNGTKAQLDAITQQHGEHLQGVRELGGQV